MSHLFRDVLLMSLPRGTGNVRPGGDPPDAGGVGQAGRFTASETSGGTAASRRGEVPQRADPVGMDTPSLTAAGEGVPRRHPALEGGGVPEVPDGRPDAPRDRRDRPTGGAKGDPGAGASRARLRQQKARTEVTSHDPRLPGACP